MERCMADGADRAGGAAGVAGPAARELAAEILRLLTAAGQTVAAAEALTGGLAAPALARAAGPASGFPRGAGAPPPRAHARTPGRGRRPAASDRHGPTPGG